MILTRTTPQQTRGLAALLPIGFRAFRRIYTIDEAFLAVTAVALLTVLLVAVLWIIDSSGPCGDCIEWGTKD